MEASPPQLPEIPEQEGTQGIEDAPELDGTEDFVSDPTTPLPRLGRGIPHQLRVVPPMRQASGDFQAEVEPNDTSTDRATRPTAILPLTLGVKGQPLTVEP